MLDYYLRYIEISKHSGESCADVVRHMKSIMVCHGVRDGDFR